MTTVLAHDVRGDDAAPALLLGSSLGTTRAMWDPQHEALAHRLRVVRYDHPGHGGSPGPQPGMTLDDLGRSVLELADRLELQRFSYAGVSLGGMVGMWLAIHAPDRVDRLALLCTSAHLPPAQMWRERAAAVRAAGTCAAISEAVVSRWFTPEFAQRCPEVLASYIATLDGVAPEGYAVCCEAIAAMDQRDELRRITAPTLVIAGAQDRSTPPSGHADVIAGAVPGALLVTLDPAAHLAGVEQPGAVTALLLDHLTAPLPDAVATAAAGARS
jgi:3-oxoadipate enol-lactonase